MTHKLKEEYDSCIEIDKINTKRSLSPELIKAYILLYNFLYERINDEILIPKLSDKELMSEWLSNENWLMIPPKDSITKESAEKSPYPNIWLAIDPDLKQMSAGIHWAQAPSVKNFLSILDRMNNDNREQLSKTFSSLKKEYIIIAETKSRKKGAHIFAPSNYKKEEKWNLKNFSPDIAEQIIKKMDEISEQGKKLKEEGKVEWALPTLQIRYKSIDGNDYETILEVIMDYMKILKVCHKILSEKQINKIKRNIIKEFNYDNLKESYKYLKFRYELGNQITEESFNSRVDELNKKIKEYNLINNTNFELFEKAPKKEAK